PADDFRTDRARRGHTASRPTARRQHRMARSVLERKPGRIDEAARHHQQGQDRPGPLVIAAAGVQVVAEQALVRAVDEGLPLPVRHRAPARAAGEDRRLHRLRRVLVGARRAVELVAVDDLVRADGAEERVDLVEIGLRPRFPVPAVVLSDTEGGAAGVVLEGLYWRGRGATELTPRRHEAVVRIAVFLVEAVFDHLVARVDDSVPAVDVAGDLAKDPIVGGSKVGRVGLPEATKAVAWPQHVALRVDL